MFTCGTFLGVVEQSTARSVWKSSEQRERESRRPDLGSRLSWAMRGGVGRVREEEKREGKQTKRGAEEQEKKRAQGQSRRVLWEREAWEKGSKGLERFR